MRTIGLLVIDDGRKAYLEECVRALTNGLWHAIPLARQILVNDSGDPEYHAYLVEEYGHLFEIVSHDERRGLAAAIQTGWSRLQQRVNGHMALDYIIHVEGDFKLPIRTPIYEMIDILEAKPSLAQLTLRRDNVNPAEDEAGSFIKQRPELYTQKEGYIEQDNLFSLNPCVYPGWLMEIGWPDNGGEREFTNKLHSINPELKFGIYGKIDDPPRCFHVGSKRSEGWKL
jgi:hypothetical protein